MDKKINIDEWKRKEHYEFFKRFEEPFHGVAVEMDLAKCMEVVRQHGYSLTRYYMYQFIRTINQSEAFRLRIRKENVYLLDTVHLGTTVLKADDTFNYILVPYAEDFLNFDQNFVKALHEGKRRETMFPAGEDTDRQIHTSILPWTAFTSLSHSRRLNDHDSVPKVSFGRINLTSEIPTIPVSIHVHHALVDGIHVGQFIDQYQKNLNS